MRKQRWVKVATGLTIPKTTVQNLDLLDLLLSPLVVVKDGKRIVLRTTREQIERYWHLIYRR